MSECGVLLQQLLHKITLKKNGFMQMSFLAKFLGHSLAIVEINLRLEMPNNTKIVLFFRK